MNLPKRVEFTTIDGTILRGDLFTADDPNAPLIVMTQGLSLLKEHFVDNFARRFQSAGISALVYDHRGWGSSKGTPKYITNPLQQAEDYHDAVTFAASLQPPNTPPCLAIWGIGHSGGASMIAGNDPRITAVVLVMPFISGAADAKGFPEGTLKKAWTNREEIAKSWATGGSKSDSSADANYVPLWPSSPENAEGKGPQTFLRGVAAYNFITEARQRSDKAGTPSVNKLSLQSFIHISNIEPSEYVHKISPRHLLYLAAVEDPLTGPLENHKKVFETAGQPKEFVVLKNHHIANYFGESFEENVGVQIDFLKKHL